MAGALFLNRQGFCNVLDVNVPFHTPSPSPPIQQHVCCSPRQVSESKDHRGTGDAH
jgi:hypothetical protein